MHSIGSTFVQVWHHGHSARTCQQRGLWPCCPWCERRFCNWSARTVMRHCAESDRSRLAIVSVPPQEEVAAPEPGRQQRCVARNLRQVYGSSSCLRSRVSLGTATKIGAQRPRVSSLLLQLNARRKRAAGQSRIAAASIRATAAHSVALVSVCASFQQHSCQGRLPAVGGCNVQRGPPFLRKAKARPTLRRWGPAGRGLDGAEAKPRRPGVPRMPRGGEGAPPTARNQATGQARSDQGGAKFMATLQPCTRCGQLARKRKRAAARPPSTRRERPHMAAVFKVVAAPQQSHKLAAVAGSCSTVE